jgi:hypothetical protein
MRPCAECGKPFQNNGDKTIITSAGCIGFHRVSVPLCAEHFAAYKTQGPGAIPNAYRQSRESVNEQRNKRNKRLGLG